MGTTRFHTLTLLVTSFVFLANVSTASADGPVCQPGVLSKDAYRIADSHTLEAFTEDGTGASVDDPRGMQIEIEFVPPSAGEEIGEFTAADRTYYCDVARSWARRNYIMTDGLHRVEGIRFFREDGTFDETDTPWSQTGSIVNWRRILEIPGAGSSAIYMTDYPMTCVPNWYLAEEGGEACIYRPDDVYGEANSTEDPARCPDPQYSCSEVESAVVKMRYWCKNEDDESILRAPGDLGAILAHEGSHLIYQISDEYWVDDPLRQFHICEESPFWNDYPAIGSQSSLMVGGGFTGSEAYRHWCDAETHQGSRTIQQTVEPWGDLEVMLDNPVDLFVSHHLPGDSSSWGQAGQTYTELQQHTPGVYQLEDELSTLNQNPLDGYVDPECLWDDEADGFGVDNDILFMVDRSGTMAATDPYDSQERSYFHQAIEGAELAYKDVPDGKRVGIYTFSEDVGPLSNAWSYDEKNGDLDLDPLDYEADGNTALVAAIEAGAQAIWDATPSDYSGQMMLLTDGQCTWLDGDYDCPNQAVRDAAFEACTTPPNGEEGIDIVVNLYGALDCEDEACGEVMQDVAASCGAMGMHAVTPQGTLHDGLPGYDLVPFDFKVSMAESAADARRLIMVSKLRERFGPEIFQNTIKEIELDVPPGSDGLLFEWLHDGVEVIDQDIYCDYASFNFELESPGSVIHVPDIDGYYSKAIRISEPATGRWKARIWSNQADCFYVQPEIAMLGHVSTGSLDGRVMIEERGYAMDESVLIEAALRSQRKYDVTNIDVTALVSTSAGERVELTMWDNGGNGDRVASDGIYTVRWNAAGMLHGPGANYVEVEFVADEATAEPVDLTYDHWGGAIGSPPNAVPTVTVRAHGMFVTNSCCLDPHDVDFPPDVSLDVTCNENHCAGPNIAPFGDLTYYGGDPGPDPGPTISRLSIDVEDFPMGTKGVQVGMGPGVGISNVTSSYDPDTRSGTVTFDATIRPEAPPGPRSVTIVSGNRQVEVPAVVNLDCVPRGGPRIDAHFTTVDTCSPGGTVVTLDLPFITDSCGDPEEARLDAWIGEVNGVPLDPVVPIDLEAPRVELPTGEAVVTWLATDAEGDTNVREQIIQVGFGTAQSCCPADAILLEGSDSTDLLFGTSVDECILGLNSTDIVYGRDGDDTLFGGPGDDILFAGNGLDTVYGGMGHDTIELGRGPGLVSGGSGNDTISGSESDDEILAGAGNDVIVAEAGDDFLVPGPGRDSVSAGAGDDMVVVYDVCELEWGEAISGGSGWDTLVSPLSALELWDLGVSVSSFEEVVVDDSQAHLSECFDG